MFLRSSVFYLVAALSVAASDCIFANNSVSVQDRSGKNHKVVEPTYTIGDYAQGGIIFWLEPNNAHGLVAAVIDQDGGSGIKWYNNTYVWVHTFADGIYLGSVYTKKIIEAQGAGDGQYAASVASNYSVTIQGVTYSDWYLPTPCELNLMYLNQVAINDGAITHEGTPFFPEEYWTSCDLSASTVETQNFSDGSQKGRDKQFPGRVRAIRAF